MGGRGKGVVKKKGSFLYTNEAGLLDFFFLSTSMAFIDLLKTRFPGREHQIDQLVQYISDSRHGHPLALYIYGRSATGKTSVVKAFLKEFELETNGNVIRSAWINCVECNMPKLIYTRALYQWFDRNFDCDNAVEFIRAIETYHTQGSLILVTIRFYDSVISLILTVCRY
jgi:Cdc6-like AAA superfamily ATPase